MRPAARLPRVTHYDAITSRRAPPSGLPATMFAREIHAMPAPAPASASGAVAGERLPLLRRAAEASARPAPRWGRITTAATLTVRTCCRLFQPPSRVHRAPFLPPLTSSARSIIHRADADLDPPPLPHTHTRPSHPVSPAHPPGLRGLRVRVRGRGVDERWGPPDGTARFALLPLLLVPRPRGVHRRRRRAFGSRRRARLPLVLPRRGPRRRRRRGGRGGGARARARGGWPRRGG